MRTEMADNISEIEVKIPKETLVDKALSKVPKRLVRIGAAVGIASGGAFGSIKPVEAKLDLNEKPGIPSIVLPEIKETKEQQEIHKVDQLKTFPLTQKEKDMISSGNITPELGSNLDKANKALVEEYKPIESVTQSEVAYNKDTGEGAVYLRFNKLQPTKDADGKEVDFTPGSVIYSGGHYMVQKEGQIVSAVIVDDKTKNFFEEVNTEDGKVQTPEVGSMTIVAKDAKTNNIDSFITGDKRYDMTDIKDAPSFSTPDAARAKMGETANLLENAKIESKVSNGKITSISINGQEYPINYLNQTFKTHMDNKFVHPEFGVGKEGDFPEYKITEYKVTGIFVGTGKSTVELENPKKDLGIDKVNVDLDQVYFLLPIRQANGKYGFAKFRFSVVDFSNVKGGENWGHAFSTDGLNLRATKWEEIKKYLSIGDQIVLTFSTSQTQESVDKAVEKTAGSYNNYVGYEKLLSILYASTNLYPDSYKQVLKAKSSSQWIDVSGLLAITTSLVKDK